MTNANNDMLREHVTEELLQCGTNTNGELVNCFERYSNKLNLIKDIEELYPFYLTILELAYLDAYKILNYKLKLNMINEQELKLFDRLETIDDINELEEEIEIDEDLLKTLLPYINEFFEMNYFSKIMSVCSMTKLQRKSLKHRFALLENDEEEYNEDVTIRTIGSYCKDIMDDSVDITRLEDLSALENDLISKLEGLIKFLAGNDTDLYECIMSEIVETDYKWNKYLINHGFMTPEEDRTLDYRMYLYKNYKTKEIVFKECMYDDEYMEDLFTSFIMIKCYNMNMDESQINEKMVDEYFYKKRNKKK